MNHSQKSVQILGLAAALCFFASAPVAAVDCNYNGVDDACDIDCAAPGCVPPDCGTSRDCNTSGVPDECEYPECSPLDLVFLIDTSDSQAVDVPQLCSDIDQVITVLEAEFPDFDRLTLAIGPGGVECTCCCGTVTDLYGTTTEGLPEELGDCGTATQGPLEDWAPATAIVAGNKAWTAGPRIVFPISDEGPRCGNPINNPGDDADAINNAIPTVRA